ncbi:MAG: general secretion pathway protein GspB [Steroidobacteraceae bacterium]|nr:general secretion pathway protein GspB [Steroidobacteraceae bacterium]
MSFILDALKKSENDRQRQSGPALFEVRVAPPRTRLPTWAVALGALLVVNLAVISWLMMKRPAVASTTHEQSAPQPAQRPAPATQPAPTPAQPIYAAPAPQYAMPPQTGTPVQMPGAQGYYAMPQPMQAPPPAWPQMGTQPQVAGGPGAAPYAGHVPAPASPGFQQQGAGSSAAPAYAPQPAAEEVNPDDYAPAIEPERPSNNAEHVYARRGTLSGLPTYDEAATRISLPPLRMDLHVYAADPTKRFVMVNMKRLNEGESLPDGVKVESITADGAILSYKGSQFVMYRD